MLRERPRCRVGAQHPGRVEDDRADVRPAARITDHFQQSSVRGQRQTGRRGGPLEPPRGHRRCGQIDYPDLAVIPAVLHRRALGGRISEVLAAGAHGKRRRIDQSAGHLGHGQGCQAGRPTLRGEREPVEPRVAPDTDGSGDERPVATEGGHRLEIAVRLGWCDPPGNSPGRRADDLEPGRVTVGAVHAGHEELRHRAGGQPAPWIRGGEDAGLPAWSRRPGKSAGMTTAAVTAIAATAAAAASGIMTLPRCRSRAGLSISLSLLSRSWRAVSGRNVSGRTVSASALNASRSRSSIVLITLPSARRPVRR